MPKNRFQEDEEMAGILGNRFSEGFRLAIFTIGIKLNSSLSENIFLATIFWSPSVPSNSEKLQLKQLTDRLHAMVFL